jgi:hypothetical protein
MVAVVLDLYSQLVSVLGFAEEREKPELLAESRERRILVAEESGKTEMISPVTKSLL